jgi:hypothetical protein
MCLRPSKAGDPKQNKNLVFDNSKKKKKKKGTEGHYPLSGFLSVSLSVELHPRKSISVFRFSERSNLALNMGIARSWCDTVFCFCLEEIELVKY